MLCKHELGRSSWVTKCSWKCKALRIGDQQTRHPKPYSISTGAKYVALHWKSRMRCSSHIQWIHCQTAVILEKCTASRALEEPWKSLINTLNHIYWLLLVSDSLDSLIRQGGLLLVVSHLFAVPALVVWIGLEEGKYLKLGCEKYFCRVTYWALLEMLLHVL